MFLLCRCISCTRVEGEYMSLRWNRREVLQGLLAASTAIIVPKGEGAQDVAPIPVEQVEIQITPISAFTFRLSILPVNRGCVAKIVTDGSLVKNSWSAPVTKLRAGSKEVISVGDLRFKISAHPVSIRIANDHGDVIQQFDWDENTGVLSFLSGSAPLLALGEGGPQFDRRGSKDSMRSGQSAYKLSTHGGRVPIPWIISTSGWGIFFHQPYGTFDFTGEQGRFQTANPGAALDFFLVASPDPATIMAEYARITGFAEMPPLWSLGYQQSHRTLASREEVLFEAKTFREKKLPCDALIYLGTGFCPSGWNTENGSFSWNSQVFSNPKEMLDELHRDHFHAVVHAVILSDRLRGTVHDSCDLTRFDEESASCYWDAHRKDFAMGIDGWWPDEGDPLDIPSRLARNRMYWEGPRMDRPNERPYALHRNGYAGMQRYASFLWSGDVYSTWETLRAHVPIAVNTGLMGIPYWGTDTGGFVPTRYLTGELYVRWFQFSAFCPLFRSHGRTWKLRLPWGWNMGETGPVEERVVPESSELHNGEVEPICRRFLELRYRLLPYNYTLIREACDTGLPPMRALWLHYPNDAEAVKLGDEYLWGRDILVAPVVEKGAKSRRLYLPQGKWYDWWTDRKFDGGKWVEREVDLATMPLYVRAGAIVPLDPVRQFTGQDVTEPTTLRIHPGADGAFTLYDDDGQTLGYRDGSDPKTLWIAFRWNDATGSLTVEPDTRMKKWPGGTRSFLV